MGLLDALIEQGLKPDANAEYIYLDRMMWVKPLVSVPVEIGAHIVVNVALTTKTNGWHMGYEFNIKGEPETRYHTNYPWAFAENTPENMVKVVTYLEEYHRLNAARKNLVALHKAIKTLRK